MGGAAGRASSRSVCVIERSRARSAAERRGRRTALDLERIILSSGRSRQPSARPPRSASRWPATFRRPDFAPPSPPASALPQASTTSAADTTAGAPAASAEPRNRCAISAWAANGKRLSVVSCAASASDWVRNCDRISVSRSSSPMHCRDKCARSSNRSPCDPAPGPAGSASAPFWIRYAIVAP